MQVRKDYFGNSKFPIQIKVNLEGQGLDENGNFVIGCMAGPSCELANLFHEMGHFAEREIPKLKRKPPSSWGYTFGKYYQIGQHSGYEPTTDESVKRELRIWAFQWHLENKYGIATSIKEMISAVVYMPAFIYYPMNGGYRPEPERLTLALEEVTRLSQTTFSLEAFDLAWFERIKALESQNA